MVNLLLESEVLELHQKITVAVRVKLQAHLNGSVGRKWRGTEIARVFGLPSNRQSELKNPSSYPDKWISQPLLKKLIAGGFITVKEIKNLVPLSDDERSYVDELEIYEDRDFHKAISLAKKRGLSSKDITALIIAKISE